MGKKEAALMAKLSPRQQQIAKKLGEGKSQSQIAKELGISYHTVRTHIRNARGRADCATMTQLAIIALRSMQ